MIKSIKLSDSFSIPAIDFANQANAILGIREAGKTYTAMKAAEQLLDSGIPIIVYDPVGVWRNLKIGKGKHKGYPIVVAGGEGADIKLTTANAVQLVRAAMKENVSLVIDLYSPELINKSTWIKVVQETVDLLMYENKTNGLRHIFLEEAAEFIPQRLQPQHSRVYASLERLARMGRNARLGMTIINQRAEEVNKAILEICAFSLLHKQVGKNSLKSIQQWLDLLQLDNVAGIIKSLPTLKAGECWAIGHTDQPKRIQVAARNTYHPDPKKGADPGLQKLAVDVTGFVNKMKNQLETEKSTTKPVSAEKKGDDKLAEENRNLKTKVQQLESEIKKYESSLTTATFFLKQLQIDAKKCLDRMDEIGNVKIKTVKFSIPSSSKQGSSQNANFKGSPPIVPINNHQGNGSISGGAERMLKAAAMFYPKPITKTRMAALARLSHTSGTFGTYLSALKRDGLIIQDGNSLAITPAGMERAGDVEPLPTDPTQLIEMWCEIIGTSSGAARMLRALGNAYPADISKEDLGAEVGMVHSSGSFGTYLSTLRRNGLIQVNSGWIKASPELFG